MQIAMATHDRPHDVTVMPADMPKGVMDIAWCNRACKSRYTTASTELSTLVRSSFASCNLASIVKCPSVQGQAQLPNDDDETGRQVPRED